MTPKLEVSRLYHGICLLSVVADLTENLYEPYLNATAEVKELTAFTKGIETAFDLMEANQGHHETEYDMMYEKILVDANAKLKNRSEFEIIII